MNNKSLAVQFNAKFLYVYLHKKLQYASLLTRYAGKYSDQKAMIKLYYIFLPLSCQFNEVLEPCGYCINEQVINFTEEGPMNNIKTEIY